MATKNSPITPRHGTVGVKAIPTRELKPNPHNPRMLFDRGPLETLKDSIKKVGILVPLTVYWDGKRKAWAILDGQRRWQCAVDLKLPTVPANEVARPGLVENIVTMFQIHQYREDWELMPTALKLGVLMDHMHEKRNRFLADLTGLDQAVVIRCKKLLSYAPKYQETMLSLDPASRVKADFFIELYAVLYDRRVKRMGWYRKDVFISQMLRRYQNGRLRSVTDFRKIKQYIANAERADQLDVFGGRLREYAANEDIDLDYLELPAAIATAKVKQLNRAVDAIRETLDSIDLEEVYGEEELWENLRDLSMVIRQKLLDVERRFQ